MTWDVTGKTCAVSGANSGIGKYTSIGLARAGARVVMVCRNMEKGEAARKEIVEASGNDDVDLMQCDMASFASIRAFTDAYKAKHDRLDMLVNNAGMMFPDRAMTEDGFERTFAVNHLAYFLVTNRLRDILEASSPARVVNVASIAHRMVARLDWKNLQGERRYGEFRAYNLSKLCNILFTFELARRLEGTGVTANCLHPGGVGSNFGSEAGVIFRNLMKLGKRFLLTPEQGARTSLYVATSPDLVGVSGEYFSNSKRARSSRITHNRDNQARLWDISADLTQLST